MAKVLIMLADGFEEIEGLAVVDLLRRARIDIETVSIMETNTVMCKHNIELKADKTFNEADFSGADMIVLPGGIPGATNLENYKPLIEKLIEFNNKGKKLAAICAAPYILGINHILEGKEATCYPGFEDKLLGAKALTDKVVVSKNVITSRGMGTAIDFGLAIIETYLGKEKAKEIADSVMYY